MPVDHPLLAVAHRRGGDEGGVRTGAGLGHGEGAAELSLQQRLEPLRALLHASVGLDPHRQELGVARVGRVVAEDHRPQGAAPQDLVEQAEADLAEAHATELGGQVRGPQAFPLHVVLEGADGLEEVVVVELEGLERQDLLVDEGARPGQLGLVLGFGLEVPRHRSRLLSSGPVVGPCLSSPLFVESLFVESQWPAATVCRCQPTPLLPPRVAPSLSGRPSSPVRCSSRPR